MLITDLLPPERILLRATAKNKKDAINMLVDCLVKSGELSDPGQYRHDVFERESQGSTGLGDGIATPHAKSSGVKHASLVAMTIPEGVDFDSLDGNPARLFFLIAAPDDASDEHLTILSRLATCLMDPQLKDGLIAAKDTDEFLSLLHHKEQEQFSTEADVWQQAREARPMPRLLAVTACPTGIAHTYMAAENLRERAEKRGIAVKIETDGAVGVKNRLTYDEIANAEAIIVAADKTVPMERFRGRRVLMCSADDAIRNADKLIDQALGGKVPVYQGTDETDDVKQDLPVKQEGLARQIYKNLMDGVSHMLPFVVGGGILIALAFLFDDYALNPANFGSNRPIAKFFKDTGDLAFGFMLPVLSGFIARSISERPGLAVGFVGGAIMQATHAGFIGAMIAGFAAGYTVRRLKLICRHLPASLDGIKTILIYPFFGILIVSLIGFFIIAPPCTALNFWLIDALSTLNPEARVLMGLILGGMMSVDMGGPVNKAAYLTGTGLLASGEYHVMAAVMAGGMVPPLAIALCTTFFRNRFTPAERRAGLTNYIMGLSFITEGAIPFAASDPIRVLPSCVIGSAVAGGMSMALDCTLRAPHGGIFVVPTIGYPLYFILAVFVGAVIGCIFMGIWKKPVHEK